MARSHLDKLKRKAVIVYAKGFRYQGILLEVTETEITLRAPTGFVTIPMDGISSIKDAAQKNETPASNKFIDQSFYDADEDPSKS